jgi:hypothetical protein
MARVMHAAPLVARNSRRFISVSNRPYDIIHRNWRKRVIGEAAGFVRVNAEASFGANRGVHNFL